MSVLLDFVSFNNLSNWSVAHILQSKFSFSKKYKIVKLKEFLSTTKMEWVNIEDDTKYPILGVRGQGQGVYINRVALGKELTMKKYQKSKQYHLFYCKVRTVKGQWGIVYPEYENSYASSNMQYLKIDLEKILPEYIELLLKIKKITDEWDKFAIGADGRHFPLNTLLNLEIPLPSLDIQKRIVDKIFNSQNILDNLKLEYKKYILEFKNAIFNKNISNEKNILTFLNYSKLNNWSVQNLLENNFNYNQSYSLVKIKKFIKRSKINTLVKDDIEYKRVKIRINNKGVSIRDKVFGKNIGTKKQFIIKEGQFLVSKIDARNGAFGIATKELEGAIITADFFAYDIDKTIINPYFLSLITTTDEFLNFAQNSSTGTTNRQRLNENLFLDVEIPLPIIEEQNSLVKPLLDNLKKQELENEKLSQALNEFEKEVFSETI